MAISEVKSGLDSIAQTIRANRSAMKQAKDSISRAVAALQSIPSDYQGVIAEIDSYDAVSGSLAERVAVSEKQELQEEFLALLQEGQATKTTLQGVDF